MDDGAGDKVRGEIDNENVRDAEGSDGEDDNDKDDHRDAKDTTSGASGVTRNFSAPTVSKRKPSKQA